MENQTIKQLFRSKFFVIGLVVCTILIVLSIISPWIISYDPLKTELNNKLIPPRWLADGFKGHILGTDSLGRDILARILIGSRYSFFVSISAVAISASIGILLGLFAGYSGGWIDNLIMRIGDVQLSIPNLLLAITVVAILGPAIQNVILVMVLTIWVQYARVIRSSVIVSKSMEYVSASKILGASNSWILFRQIFPNVLTPCLVLASQQIGWMIFLEATMSFLGMGVPSPTPSWGTMISLGRNYLYIAPWVVLVPGIALMITVLAFNFIGDGVRDAFDPKMRSK